MLSTFENGILELIKCALNGGTPVLDESFNLETAYTFSQERQITPILYYGAVNIPNFMDTIIGKKFFKSTINMSFYCSEQDDIINSLRRAFKDNEIQHLLVKGTIIRSLYPYPEMRLMSDADILIKEEQYPKIKEIMTQLGFTEEYESDHELVWKKNGFSIELHKRLVPSYNKDYFKYFGDGWKLAKIKDEESGAFLMTDEDSFIYSFVHYAMHYRNGGIGVKHVTDFHVILKSNPNLNMDYIEKELENLSLLDFWKNTKKLLDVWFDGKAADEMTDFMTAKIFGSGAYGTVEGRLNSEAVRTGNTGNNVKSKKLFSLIFPPYNAMCQKYPFLKKAAILLPLMWVIRWFEAIFTPSKITNQKQNLDALTTEGVSKYHNELKYVGLNFNFDEH